MNKTVDLSLLLNFDDGVGAFFPFPLPFWVYKSLAITYFNLLSILLKNSLVEIAFAM